MDRSINYFFVRFPKGFYDAILLMAFLLVLAGNASSLHAQLTGPIAQPSDLAQTAKGIVVEVIFEGNKSLSSAELTTVVSTKAVSWVDRLQHSVIKGLGSDYQEVEPTRLERDTAALALYYKDHGYINAKARYRLGPNAQDLAAYKDYLAKSRTAKVFKNPKATADQAPVLKDTVIFTIEEGQPSNITGIAFSGLENLPEEFQPELTEHSLIKRDSQWSRARAMAEVDRLRGIMTENGWPYFKFDTIFVDYYPKTKNVHAILTFTPGHRYKYGPTEIVYDTNSVEHSRVSDKVILSQITFKEGDWYKLSEVSRSEQNLYKISAFEIARITLDTSKILSIPDSLRDSAKVPVEILLRMRQRAEITFGPFTGTGIGGFIFGGTVNFNDHNLTNVGDNINLSASYQLLPTNQVRNNASIDYSIPYIGIKRVPLLAGVGFTLAANKDSTGGQAIFTEKNYNFHVGSNIILSNVDNRSQLNPLFTFEYITNQVPAGTPDNTLPPKQLNFIPQISYQDDRTNDIFNPTSGHFFGVSTEVGLPFKVGGLNSSSYVNLVPQIKYYFDLSNNGSSVLASRLRLGRTLLFYPDDLGRVPPLERRFYAGGQNSVRGWPNQALLVSLDPYRNLSFGGYEMLIEFNTELRYAPFNYPVEFSSSQRALAPLRLAVFLDAGNVWDYNIAISTKQIAIATGLGIRYNILFGALRLDWGLKLYDPTGDFSDQYHPATPSSVGHWLWEVKRPLGPDIFTWQFAIGQAF